MWKQLAAEVPITVFGLCLQKGKMEDSPSWKLDHSQVAAEKPPHEMQSSWSQTALDQDGG